MNSILIQNIGLPIVITGITFAILFLLHYLHKKKAISIEVSRKVVHIGAGTLYLGLYLYNDYGYLSKYFNIFPNVFWTGVLIWKSQRNAPRVRQQYDLVISAVTRTNCESELLYGPLFFNFAMILCGTLYYKTVLGCNIIGLLTWGDGFAAIIGGWYGSQRKIYGNKTLDGLLTFFLAGCLASIFYTSVLLGFESVHVFKFCIISFVAAIVESLTPSDFDNLTIPLSAIFTYYFLF